MRSSGSIRNELRHGAALLAATSTNPTRDAALLLCRALGKDRPWLLTHAETPLTSARRAAFHALLGRRLIHEPMQYILGEQEFYGLRLRVTPAVLIPRPETEHLVEAVLARAPHDAPLRIADVGTGSGAIAIALAHSLPQAQVDALDLSPAALRVAEENARAHEVDGRIRFLQSDLLAAVAGARYDVIVSNPPYVAEGETLEPQVSNWEPHAALFAGADGLDIYRRLLPEAAASLAPEGLLAVECGCGQRDALEELLDLDRDWRPPAWVKDLQGHDRVLLTTICQSER